MGWGPPHPKRHSAPPPPSGPGDGQAHRSSAQVRTARARPCHWTGSVDAVRAAALSRVPRAGARPDGRGSRVGAAAAPRHAAGASSTRAAGAPTAWRRGQRVASPLTATCARVHAGCGRAVLSCGQYRRRPRIPGGPRPRSARGARRRQTLRGAYAPARRPFEPFHAAPRAAARARPSRADET